MLHVAMLHVAMGSVQRTSCWQGLTRKEGHVACEFAARPVVE
jgi:hypothetical protein